VSTISCKTKILGVAVGRRERAEKKSKPNTKSFLSAIRTRLPKGEQSLSVGREVGQRSSGIREEREKIQRSSWIAYHDQPDSNDYANDSPSHGATIHDDCAMRKARRRCAMSRTPFHS